jgi:hypothetical protein
LIDFSGALLERRDHGLDAVAETIGEPGRVPDARSLGSGDIQISRLQAQVTSCGIGGKRPGERKGDSQRDDRHQPTAEMTETGATQLHECAGC